MIFSNNAPGFPHLSLNTSKPAKTFLGHFEGQILMGKLFSSGFAPTQYPTMNERYFSPLNPDWRYLSAFLFSYSPKWIPQLTMGIARTFQQYGEFVQPTFEGLIPIFEYFQKEKYFKGGNQFFVDYDTAENDRNQQAMVFGRYQS